MWGLAHPEERAFLNLFYHSPNICEEVKEQAYADFVWMGELYAGAAKAGIVVDLPLPSPSSPLSCLQVTAGCPGMTTDEIIDAGLRVLWEGIGT